MAEISKEQVKEFLSKLTVLELADLTKELEADWGVSAAAPMAMAAMPMQAAEEVEEPTEFDVILKEIGSEKIKVIKEVRAVTSLGLKEAKAVVDDFPSPIKEAISKEEAEEIKKQFEAVGATIEIKASWSLTES